MMMRGLSPGKIKDISPEGSTSILSKGEEGRNIFFGTILGIFIFITAAITFTVAAIMLFLRVVTLWLVMILAPAALFLWALPATEGYGKEWLMILIRQSIFLPVLVFMLSLAVYLSVNIHQVPEFNIDQKLNFSNQGSFLPFVAGYIVIIILFNAALVFSISLS